MNTWLSLVMFDWESSKGLTIISILQNLKYTQIKLYILYTWKYWFPFYFRPLRSRCKRENWRLDTFWYFKLSLFKQNCVWSNWRWDKTVEGWKLRRAKKIFFTVYVIKTHFEQPFFCRNCYIVFINLSNENKVCTQIKIIF